MRKQVLYDARFEGKNLDQVSLVELHKGLKEDSRIGLQLD
jgi:hypothetical protein